MENKGLQDLMGSLFGNNDNVASDLETMVGVLERHGVPASMKQSKALAYAEALCPDSEVITSLRHKVDSARYHAIEPELFLAAFESWTLANKVTGRIPLSKYFNGQGGGEK